MSLRGRLANLEKLRGGSDAPLIIFVIASDHPPLTESEKGRLTRDAMKRNPGAPLYIIMWPPQERGEDAS